MKTQNRVNLVGYVGDDPVLRTLPSGTMKAFIRVATHIQSKETKDEWIPTWHNVIAWNEDAQKLADNFSKGSHILLEGSLQYRTYADKQGQTQYVTEISTTHFLNLDR
ncbi:MAG: single-stranded DNA-binding protein [Sediminibacterium sp.]